MSSDLIRLTVVTDNAERASLAIFGFRLQTAALEAPWCRFVDKAYQIPGIPDKAAVMAIWFDEDVLLEIRWFNERHKRPFKDDWCEQAERVNDWLAKRQAKELALIAEAMTSTEQPEGSPPPLPTQPMAPPPPTRPTAPPPPAELPAELPKVMWS